MRGAPAVMREVYRLARLLLCRLTQGSSVAGRRASLPAWGLSALAGASWHTRSETRTMPANAPACVVCLLVRRRSLRSFIVPPSLRTAPATIDA